MPLKARSGGNWLSVWDLSRAAGPQDISVANTRRICLKQTDVKSLLWELRSYCNQGHDVSLETQINNSKKYELVHAF